MKPTNVHKNQRTIISRDPEVLPLSVYDIMYKSGGGSIVSAWKPSLRERLSILFFGKVYLLVQAERHPPVLLLANKKEVFGE